MEEPWLKSTWKMVGSEMKTWKAEKLCEDYETKILPYNYISCSIVSCHATIISFEYAAKEKGNNKDKFNEEQSILVESICNSIIQNKFDQNP